MSSILIAKVHLQRNKPSDGPDRMIHSLLRRYFVHLRLPYDSASREFKMQL